MVEQKSPRSAHHRKTSPEPEFYMPAMPPMALVTALENGVRELVRRWRLRRQIRRLLACDDRTLEDMGHHREALRRAAHRPLWQAPDSDLLRQPAAQEPPAAEPVSNASTRKSTKARILGDKCRAEG